MIDSRAITFFSLLAVLCCVFLVVVAVVGVVSLVRGGLPRSLVPVRDAIGEVGLWMAFAVAATTTFGSLWLSEVENLPPCLLCWYQRIAMYPLSVILGVAALRRDAAVRWYVLPIAVVGAAISTYHYLLERFPDSVASSCDLETPCTTVWIWKFHFLSIPGMAWIAFVTIAVLVLLARPSGPVRGGRREQAGGGRGATVSDGVDDAADEGVLT